MTAEGVVWLEIVSSVNTSITPTTVDERTTQTLTTEHVTVTTPSHSAPRVTATLYTHGHGQTDSV